MFLGIDLGSLLDRPREFDVVFASRKCIDAHFLRPGGGFGAEDTSEVPILGFEQLQRKAKLYDTLGDRLSRLFDCVLHLGADAL